MLNQKNNAVNPSRDLFVVNKSANKIRAFNAAIPSDFSTITKPDAARIKKEALELVNLVSYALSQRALKIDVLDDEKKRIETTKHVSIIYYSLNLIASQLATTARKIAEKLETETEPTTELTETEPTTTEPTTTTTETTEPETKTVEPEPGAVLELVSISDAVKKDIRDFIARFQTIGRARKDVYDRLYSALSELRRFCRANHIRRGVFVDRPFKPSKIHLIASDWEDMRKISNKIDDPREYSRRIAKLLENTLTTYYNHVFTVVKPAPAISEPAPVAVPTVEPKQEEETPAPVAVVVSEPKQATPAPAADNRDALINETFDAITKRIIKASEAVPYMLEKSIKDGCPLWSQKWFSFAELPRKYFDGTLYSVNNMVLMGFHAGFYISESEARRLLGAKIKPDARAIARRVLMPVFKDAKTPNKQELDALRNCEPIADETKTRRPDFYRVEKVYDQTAFNGLTIKKSRELPNNENERNARAEKVLREFCAANNIVFSSVLGLGQAVCEHVENPAAPIRINVPDISQFKSSASYYSVVFHECTHAANRRNGCQLTKNREELAAEIGACIVLNSLGFDPAEYIDDAGAYVRKFKDTASEKNAIKKAWKYAQASALLILKSFIDDAIHADDDAPKQEPKTEEAPAPVKNDDEESIVSALETFEREATQAINTFGIVHQDNARRAENDALLAIEEARKNMSVPDDALRIYSDRVERIHVDTALALKKEATRRYGTEWIERHVTFC